MDNKKTKKKVPVMAEGQAFGMTRCENSSTSVNVHPRYMGTHAFSNGINAGVFIGGVSAIRFNGEKARTVSVNGIGTDGLGFIEWGYANSLPNAVAQAAKRSPYIAPVMKFNSETMYARGPKPKYRYAHTHNGHVAVETVDYQFAGVFIKEQIRKARMDLKMLFEDGEPVYDENDIKDEIETLQKDYETWLRTWKEIEAFIRDNDLQDFTLQSCIDMQYYNICFPEVGLSMGRTSNSEWNPKIVELRPLKCVHTRLEERDKKGIINYVYYSKMWSDDATLNYTAGEDRIIAIPSIDIRQGARQLRAKNKNKSFSERTFRYCIPISYASVDKDYYPEPAWYSLFRSSIYEYSLKLIEDKNIVKKNDNSWGKIVYINGMYLQQLYVEQAALSDLKKKKEIEDNLYKEIDEFLSADENAGKPLVTYTIVGNDGKEFEAVKIVNAPQSVSGSETKSELEEIASIMYAAQDMHPSMNGAVPGKNSQTGGTQIRELLGTKNVRLEPMRDYVLKVFSFISSFNEWDENLVWEMPYSVLTTLDANKTGIEENKE